MDPDHEAALTPGVDSAGWDIPALYDKHKDVMYRVARSMLRGDGLQRAEDVVQDVMLSVLQRPPDGVRNWEAFFVKAVKRKIYDLWKSAAHQHERLVLDDAIPLEDELGADGLGLDVAVVVEETLEREGNLTRMRGALAELARTDPKSAYVYRQVKLHERSSRELAAEMKVSDSRIRQHVMRARTKLMEILGANGGGR